MFAPSFPHFKTTRKTWHMVHSLVLYRTVCNTGVVNCVEANEEVPEGEYYCSICSHRERFVGKLIATDGQSTQVRE